MKKNQRGVTLIALVVTIIVLLILAATAIATLTGEDGIITNAQKAQAANTEGEAIDKLNLAYNAVYTNAMVKMSTVNGYQPSEATNANELADIAAKEIGAKLNKTAVPDVATVPNGYTVYVNGATITLFYKDAKFVNTPATKGPDGTITANTSDNLYPMLKAEITLKTNGVEYSLEPIRSVK